MKSIGFAGLFVVLAAGAAAAQPGADSQGDVLTAMLQCSQMTDRGARLTCYDEAVLRAPGALTRPALSAPPAAATASAAPPASIQRRDRGFLSGIFGPDDSHRPRQTTVAEFGSESIASGGAKAYPGPLDSDTIDQITARLVRYDVQGGFMTVTLDNGQVWRQVSGDAVGHLARPAVSYGVTIDRGALAGAYSMKLSHFARTLQVRRIR